jgi:hypothetical protein
MQPADTSADEETGKTRIRVTDAMTQIANPVRQFQVDTRIPTTDIRVQHEDDERTTITVPTAITVEQLIRELIQSWDIREECCMEVEQEIASGPTRELFRLTDERDQNRRRFHIKRNSIYRLMTLTSAENRGLIQKRSLLTRKAADLLRGLDEMNTRVQERDEYQKQTQTLRADRGWDSQRMLTELIEQHAPDDTAPMWLEVKAISGHPIPYMANADWMYELVEIPPGQEP